jgi:hypothetical protein
MTSGVSVNFFVRPTESTDTDLVHIVYYYDVTPPTDPERVAFSAEGTYFLQTQLEDPVVWKNVPAGKHTFSAQLVDSQTDMPFDPPVITQNTIDVPPPVPTAPEIRNISVLPSLPNPSFTPETPQPVGPLEVQVACTIHNFKMNDDSIGQQNVSGEGHLIYYFDVQPPTAPGQPALTEAGTYKISTDDFHVWSGVTPGRHMFSIQIVNNDNTPLNPPVFSQIIVTLPSRL